MYLPEVIRQLIKKYLRCDYSNCIKHGSNNFIISFGKLKPNMVYYSTIKGTYFCEEHYKVAVEEELRAQHLYCEDWDKYVLGC